MAAIAKTNKTNQAPSRGRIVTDPKVDGGKPTVRETAVPVERILLQLAGKPDLADVLALYPELTMDDLRAVFAYAAGAVQAVTASGEAATVEPYADIRANYDPEKALQAVDRLRESLRGVDFEQWKAEVRAARGHTPDEDAT